ncbi:hypothetical protein CCMSSC00406_0004896 [Pleurotus cornucopiae]|uniref:Uncharacterized protein n=1 Tax=Pleurotus cornucopiae TaxID=5321 RepID=A0ACB7IZQ1_PLECO|nr:hypothetical protein CCMSSC00406_0004896 [Pleurotus cornucopiae]
MPIQRLARVFLWYKGQHNTPYLLTLRQLGSYPLLSQHTLDFDVFDKMTTSSLLNNFDPFATHPFTNTSGIMPEPPRPSQHTSSYPATAYQPSQPSRNLSQQQGTPRSPNGQATQPIFVPFRQDTSSPDLSQILKKKSS